MGHFGGVLQLIPTLYRCHSLSLSTSAEIIPELVHRFSFFPVSEMTFPAVGLGTFQGDAGNRGVKEAVLQALRCGYRHIDTATAYGNEIEVGEAIKESRIPREEIIVTTKLAQTWHRVSDVERALDLSLERLQLNYGLSMHLYSASSYSVPHAYSPGPDNNTIRHPNGKPIIDHELSRDYPSTWAAMESLVDKGKLKMIGVSNFNILKLERLLGSARIPPAVNQIELHPYLPQVELVRFCKANGIHLVAHQPLGGKPVAAVNPNADRPASKHERSPAQIILSWIVQQGISVIPKTVRQSRMVENLDLKQLPDKDMETIYDLSKKKGEVRYLDPKNHIGFNIFDERHDQPVQE
ncbi:uncharacterized protein An01g14370 [Aspergillus niger]|uniref:D-xylose reductase [NAD(P)H] n=2 Tax=Aspergillus niger TaxID=5061 RepID=A2QB88_ASPNC|nr:uncharacterized protein An01g14370 [Aspergillus niger]CAK37432.1 unnamed protein product [Aspergillus niger]